MRESPAAPVEDAVNWECTTFAGARREQLRRWSRLSLRQIIQALEEMEDLGQRLAGAAQDRAGK